MATPPTIIYCGRANYAMDSIAVLAGFKYGVRLPFTVKFPLYFADQNWKIPVRSQYMAALEKHKPEMATVLDLEYPQQLDEVMSWAEEAAQHTKTLVIIPKYSGAVLDVPEEINGVPVRMGYSVPTKHGATNIPIEEFGTRPVHLLGGQPHVQYDLSFKMNVVSIDCNYFSLKATKYCSFWRDKRIPYTMNRNWIALSQVGIPVGTKDSYLIAFSISCANIISLWNS